MQALPATARPSLNNPRGLAAGTARLPAEGQLSVIRINNDAEKTKSDSDEPVRKRRYTEVLQRQNRLKNEKASASLPSANLSDIFASRQKSILPPSKLFIGSRFSIARKQHDIRKYSKNSLALPVQTCISG